MPLPSSRGASFEDLTVAMLCDRAMIRRTTFYKHFRDKNDYFAFYIDELMSGLPQKQPMQAARYLPRTCARFGTRLTMPWIDSGARAAHG
ncbi:MAG: hypothetical protein ACLU0O_04550 [Collinsella sp.]